MNVLITIKSYFPCQGNAEPFLYIDSPPTFSSNLPNKQTFSFYCNQFCSHIWHVFNSLAQHNYVNRIFQKLVFAEVMRQLLLSVLKLGMKFK